MKKVIVFDLDGTLINSLGDIHAALNKVLRSRGATPLDLPTVRGFIGMGSKNLVMRALTARNLPNDDASVAAGLHDFLSIYSAGATELTYVFEGAKDALTCDASSRFLPLFRAGQCAAARHRDCAWRPNRGERCCGSLPR